MENNLNSKKHIITVLINSILSLVTIAFVLIAMKTIITSATFEINLVYGVLAIISLIGYQTFKLFRSDAKIDKTRYLVSVSILTISAVLWCLYPLASVCRLLSFELFIISFMSGRVFKIISNKNKVFLVANILLLVVLLLLGLGLLGDTSEVALLFVSIFEMIVIMFLAIGNLVFSAVSKKTVRLLFTILQKTHSIEILLGLLSVMVAFSLLFPMVEEKIPSFVDGLWYCFAVVTTIGFGDFYAATMVGRIMTVILGIYGLVVVAIITSIIVNFYNESAKESSKDEIEEFKELMKKEHENSEAEEDV